MIWGLTFKLGGLYFNTFRKPTSTSAILTYSVPPFTTIRGLLSNALGLQRDDFSLQDSFKIGIKSVMTRDASRELAKILKLKGTGKHYQRSFPSAPIFKEFLVKPSYEIFLVGDQEIIAGLYEAISDPKRPLYLGGSDELVEIEYSKPTMVREITASEVHSAVEGVHPNSIVEKLPYKFTKRGRDYSLEYLTVSVPQADAIDLSDPVKCFVFGSVNVAAY
ncbi:MAG TPA: CRISPR-associated protein Cas5 [Thermotogaceae bacterium]|nr:CRISPR-associated protein Cas5 [Thermotogaceae bacterium]